MEKKDYIGLDLAKKLHESGFEAESKMYWGYVMRGSENDGFYLMNEGESAIGGFKAYSYYQILTTLAKKLFKQEYDYECAGEYNSAKVLDMLQERKTQEEIDKYIWDNLDEKWKNN